MIIISTYDTNIKRDILVHVEIYQNIRHITRRKIYVTFVHEYQYIFVTIKILFTQTVAYLFIKEKDSYCMYITGFVS